jgi:hypothetical protein
VVAYCRFEKDFGLAHVWRERSAMLELRACLDAPEREESPHRLSKRW